MKKLSKAQQIQKLTELIEAFGDHNHWAKRPSAFMRSLAEKAGVEDSLKWWSEIGDKLMLIGAGADLVQSALTFYFGDTRLDIAGNERWAAALFYGAVHAAVMYGTTVGTAALIDGLTEGLTEGAATPVLVASQGAIDIGSGLIGGVVADHATPAIFDLLVPTGSLPDNG